MRSDPLWSSAVEAQALELLLSFLERTFFWRASRLIETPAM
jgi:hypothetical protein